MSDSVWKSKFTVRAVIVAIVIVVGLSSFYLGRDNATEVAPHQLTGKFDGLSIGGQSIAFQPEGSTTATSFAWSGDTMWTDSTGVVKFGHVACVQASQRGHTITIGVVNVKSDGTVPGTMIIAFVKC